MLTDRMGIDIWEVVDAASTKPYGFMRFEPGPGMGGHCLPVDPFYLSWRAREFDMTTEFIELAGKVNQQMPYHCVEKAQRALNDAGRAVKGSRVLVVGVSYKPGVGDVRESPALKIITLLRELGAEVGLPRPARARPRGVRPVEHAAGAGRGRRRPGADRDRAPERRPRAASRAARAWWSTCAASRAAPPARTSCGCERRRAHAGGRRGAGAGRGGERGRGRELRRLRGGARRHGDRRRVRDRATTRCSASAPGSRATRSAQGAVGALELGAGVTVGAGAIVFAGAASRDGAIVGDQSFVRERSSVGSGLGDRARQRRRQRRASSGRACGCRRAST